MPLLIYASCRVSPENRQLWWNVWQTVSRLSRKFHRAVRSVLHLRRTCWCCATWNHLSTFLNLLALLPGGTKQCTIIERWTLYVTVGPRVRTLWDLGVRRHWGIDAAPNFWSRSPGSGTSSLQSHCQSMSAPETHTYTHTHALLLPPAECINYGLTGGCWMNTPQG